MKMGIPNKMREDQWHYVNKPGKFDSQHEDQPRKYPQKYNQQHYENEPRPYHNKPYDRPGGYEAKPGYDKPRYDKPGYVKSDYPKRPFEKRPEEIVLDPDNKFFSATHKVDSEEHIPKFSRSGHAEESEKSESAKLQKPNPFGDAKPRDEKDYVKRKEEEKKITEPEQPKNQTQVESSEAPTNLQVNTSKPVGPQEEIKVSIETIPSPPPGISSPYKKGVNSPTKKETEEETSGKQEGFKEKKKYQGKNSNYKRVFHEKPEEAPAKTDKKPPLQSQPPTQQQNSQSKQDTKVIPRKLSAKANVFASLNEDDESN